MWEKILLGVGAAALAVVGVVAVAALLILATLTGTFFGGVAGWIVGWFFTDTILGVLAAVGIKGVTMWQLGATLGFLGGFVKSVQTNSNNN